MIFHIDANSFYASCECIFRPDLAGKPVAVLSNNDGITIALNQDCKRLGFTRGDAWFRMRNEYGLKGVSVFSSNYTLYADISRRLNLVYCSFCPDVEQYSIDESFLFFPDWRNAGFNSLASEIRQTVLQQIHIPVSIGMAPTKTLAKLCNKLAKERGGICNWNDLDQDRILSEYPVKDLWGIGKAKAAVLVRYGVKTVFDLKYFPLDKAKKLLTITGFRTVQELHGIRALDETELSCRQNITTSRSFAHGVTGIAEIETALAEYTQLAVTRMRQEDSACKIVSVYLMTARAYCEADKEKEYYNSAAAQLPHSTSYLPDILSIAKDLLHSIYRRNYLYRKVMINLLFLEPDKTSQPEMFREEEYAAEDRKKALMAACDKICEKYGRGTIHPAVRNQVTDIQKCGIAADWIMGRKFLSPEYTTKFSDIPGVL
jgi:DNA polymerase V